MDVELLRFMPQSDRADAWLAAMARGATALGVSCETTHTYRGGAAVLLLWGAGAPDRVAPMRQQLAAGGHVVCADLAYWQRERKVRISIDAPHPQAWVMRRDWPVSRLRLDGVSVAADGWTPAGPILVAGVGRKARVQYGAAIDTWERAQITACHARWPTRPIIYRRKQRDVPMPDHLPPVRDTLGLDPIAQALVGVSLVLTWHSNVAVDALRAGLPVICQDGAAAAVCPATLGPTDPVPLPLDLRARFLANLAWFQWSAAEATACWQFLHALVPS